MTGAPLAREGFLQEPRGDWIGGRWIRPAAPDGALEIASPGDTRERRAVPFARSAVDAAVAAARAAAPAWQATPLEERIRAVEALGRAIEALAEPLARAMAWEVGKPLAEARAEVRTMASRGRIAVEHALPRIAERRLALAPGREGRWWWRPRGVAAVLGPFNFPGHLVHAWVVPALLAGNTVVVKPSEKACLVGQWYAEACERAGLPRGAVNVVFGDAASGAALAAHRDVDAVLFTGSWRAGRAILERTLEDPWKLVALEMGGKNAAIVLEDAPFEAALFGVAYGATATAGQRCSSTSRLVLHRAVAEPFLEKLARILGAMRPGAPLDPATYLGPVVTAEARERHAALHGLAREAGATCLLAGGPAEGPAPGHWVRPSLHRLPSFRHGGAYAREEHFVPDLAGVVVEDDEEALAEAAASDYGLVASVYTARRERFLAIASRLRVGVVNWNAPTVGADGRLPFGGLGRSGNDRPAGVLAIEQCAAPVASIEVGRPEPGPVPEGFPVAAVSGGSPPLRHTLLMGDPTHFSVVGGANPHTRDRWGRRKRVDRALAIAQWHALHALLRDLGFRVVVLPPVPEHPGLVYPANAGVRLGDDFVLSNLVPTRAGEQPYYRRAVEALGLRVHAIRSRFEGEADLFPAGGGWIFTWGEIRRQRFVPRLGWPPWRRVYGFRSDPRALEEIEAIHPLEGEVLRIELRDERYYHGDTCLCSFGRGREHLLAYLPVLAPEGAALLRERFGERLVPIGEEDAAIYAANSFAATLPEGPILVMPAGVSEGLRGAVRERGVQVFEVDVTEFYKKGGGSVKCMIGDLGLLPARDDPEGPSPGNEPAPPARDA